MGKELPKLVMQEPTATGWQRTEIYGDQAAGKAHIHDARKLLGGMRSHNGVNERIAAGQAGGFYHQWAMHADGTRFHVITNDGHDTVRIYPPGGEPTPPPEPPEPKPSGAPYMWVGLRVRYDQCRSDRWALTSTMVEPDSAELRGIVNDNYYIWAGIGDVQQNGNSFARVGSSGQGIVPLPDNWTVQDLLLQHHAQFMGEGSEPFTIQRRKQLRHHNFWIIGDEPIEFFCSANGLRLYNNRSNSYPPSELWGPYDPLMDAAQNAGEGRDSSGLILDESEEGERVDMLRGWDAVYVLDPHEAMAMPPCDARPHILAASQMMYDAGMVRGEAQVLPGEYLLTVNAMGEISPESARAGETIPVEHNPPLGRGRYCDYIERIEPLDYTLPMVVEVEVRLGKMALDAHPQTRTMNVFNFTLTCDDYHVYENVSLPFGYGEDADYDECTGYPGSNPLGPNYSDFIAINVLARTAELKSKGAVELAPIFGGGIYKALDGQRKNYLDVYIFGDYGVSQVDQADYPRKAGQALWKMLELATSGTWGCAYLSEQSEAQLIAACAGITKGSVWRYDPIAHTITALPVLDSTDAMKADPQYNDWMGWYYPYRKATRSECRQPMAILLQATEVFVYDASPGYGPDDHEDYDCCT